MSPARVLVAGIGNIFLGDDAFGIEVVGRLADRRLPQSVRVVDFGIRGLDLAYALVDGYEAVVLVDAAPRGGSPGSLYVIEPDVPEPDHPIDPLALAVDAHRMDPARTLDLARSMGALPGRVLLVGCEPSPLLPGDDVQFGLSAPVAEAVGRAVELIEGLLADLLGRANPAAAASQPDGPVEASNPTKRQ